MYLTYKKFPFKVVIIVSILSILFSPLVFSETEYNQPPEFKSAVEKGKLPPLKDRLPDNPKVVEVNKVGKYGGQVRVGQGWKFQSLWPWQTVWSSPYIAIDYEGLYTTSQPDDTKAEPNLAKKVEVGPEQKVYTFHLRKGVKWSDGVEFTAEDVVFTYNSILNKKLATLMNSRVKDYLKGSEIYKVGKYTVQLEFERARKPEWVKLYLREGSMLQPGAFDIVPKHYYKEYHPKYNDDATLSDLVSAGAIKNNPPVLGPWKPVRRSSGYIFFERNPYYWKVDQAGNQLPYLDKLVAKRYQNENAYAIGMIAGEHDVVPQGQPYGPLPTLLQEKEDSPYNVYMPPGKSAKNVGMTFNLDVENESLRSLVRNQKFINAISQGINRKKITSLFPGSKPSYRPYYRVYGVPPIIDDTKFWEPIWDKQKFDLEAAKRKLDDLGVKDVDNDGLREYPSGPKEGKTVKIELLLESNEKDRVRVAEAAASMLKKNLGLDINIKPLEMATYLTRVKEKGNFEAKGGEGTYAMPWGFVSNTTGFTPMGPDTKPFWHSKTGWGDPFDWEVKARKMIEEGQNLVVKKPEKAKELMVELQTLLGKNLPWIGILKWRSYFAIADRFANVPFEIYPSWRKGKGPFSQAVPIYTALDIHTWWDTRT